MKNKLMFILTFPLLAITSYVYAYDTVVVGNTTYICPNTCESVASGNDIYIRDSGGGTVRAIVTLPPSGT